MAEYKFEDIAINSTQKKKPVEEDKYHYLGLEHLDPGTFTISRFGSEVAPIGEKLLMKKGDVLFGKRRAYQKKVAIAPFDGIFSAHGMVLRPKENVVDKDFFPLFIASDYFLDAAINISVGSLSPTINWRDLKELKFTLPTLAEQKKLAEVLWAIVATMESYKKLLVKTDELVKAKFVEMFGKKEDYESKWGITKIKEVCNVIAGYPFNSELFTTDSAKTPLIRIRDVVRGYTETFTSEDYDDCYIIRKGDLLIGMDGDFYISEWKTQDAVLNQRVCKISGKDKLINDLFLKIFLQPYLTRINNNTAYATVKHISIKQIENIDIPVSPIELQNKFADFVQKAEESKSATQVSLDSLTKLYKKIIAENLGGKVNESRKSREI